MALFFVGYLIATTSTIAFIVAILIPQWIYPNNLPVTLLIPSSPNSTDYRGIFYVDYGYPNGTCRDYILIYKDSVSTCRPSKSLKKRNLFLQNIFIYFSLCCSMCIISNSRFLIINYSSLACWWLFIYSSSTSSA